ncbi:hypothetical protein D3C78_746410 [compost metagenome]
MLAGEGQQLRAPRHAAVVVDDLAEHARRPALGQQGEVERRLGVAGPLEHAAGLGAQREDVPGTGEVVRLGGRIGQGVEGQRAVGGGNAGAGTVTVIDADGEGGLVRLGVGLDHQRQLERIEALAGQRDADQAAAVADQEGHLRGRDGVGGDDQIAFVLAVGVVDHDDEFAAGDGGKGGLDGVESGVGKCGHGGGTCAESIGAPEGAGDVPQQIACQPCRGRFSRGCG